MKRDGYKNKDITLQFKVSVHTIQQINVVCILEGKEKKMAKKAESCCQDTAWLKWRRELICLKLLYVM